jgi:hypothetical protein
MTTTSLWSETTRNPDLEHETGAQGSCAKATQTPMTVPIASAALSSRCIVTMAFVEYPWFAVAGFVAAYGLFWISLSGAAISQAKPIGR